MFALRRFVAPLAFLVCTAQLSAGGATFTVPGTHGTIQAAIDAASDGTTILIGPGTYAEALDVSAVDVTLIGTSGAAATIVDATGLGVSVLSAPTGGGSTVFVEGLTLTGGAAQFGAGVNAIGISLTARECVITGNSANVVGGRGGGARGGVFLDCEISFNEAKHGGGAEVAGLIDCTITNNFANFDGGGVSQSTATNCVITDNTAGRDGGGVHDSLDKVTHCFIANNLASRNGGGMHDHDLFFPLTITDNVVFDNLSGAAGGGLYLDFFNTGDLPDPITIERMVFAENRTNGSGDGVFLASNPFIPLLNVLQCTIVNNALAATEIEVTNTIHLGLEGLFAPGIITYSNMEGGFAGTGNIDADPLFADPANGNYSLLPGSPCINTGSPAYPSDPDGSPADMGAIAYHPWSDVGSGLAGVSGALVNLGTGPLTDGSSNAFELENAASSAATFLVVGFSELSAPFKQGVLIPEPDVLVSTTTDALGKSLLPFSWPAAVPSGVSLWAQWWVVDATGPAGFSSTAGIVGTTP